jgi:UDP-glucose 4-epimerase
VRFQYLELAKLIIKQTNSKSEITFTSYEDAYAAGFEDMARRVPDISKTQLVLLAGNQN